MTSATDIEKELTDLLNDAARQLNLRKYSLNLNLDALKGDGFLGEFYKVSITDDDNNSTIDFAVKRAPADEIRRKEISIELIYENEIFFYSEIFPVFQKFEKEHGVPEPFNLIPEYITSNSEVGKESLVFKDITKAGFQLREKDLLLDDEHTRLIFKAYGHFHAISFCLKEQKPEEFKRLTKPLHNIWEKFGSKDSFINLLSKIAQKSYDGLDPSKDGAIMEKFKKYINNTKQIYKESSTYNGQYFGILHGDCWSNNMMFKYQDPENHSKLIDMNLLDFQLVMVGTPIYDLSYFFYTGGSKELFDKLEDYLDIYYESFSKCARNLGSNPNNLLPREILSQDWRRYSRFGMILSTILIKIKLINKQDTIEMIETAGQNKNIEENRERFMDIKYNEDLFNERIRNVLIHLHEIDAL